VVQNDVGNRVSKRTIIVPITGAEHISRPFPLHVRIPAGEGGLTKESIALCDQIRVIDKVRIVRSMGNVSRFTMEKLDAALKISLGLS
jgi:mRNA interferase MazF